MKNKSGNHSWLYILNKEWTAVFEKVLYLKVAIKVTIKSPVFKILLKLKYKSIEIKIYLKYQS